MRGWVLEMIFCRSDSMRFVTMYTSLESDQSTHTHMHTARPIGQDDLLLSCLIHREVPLFG